MIRNRFRMLLALPLLAAAGCGDSEDPIQRAVFPATGVVKYRGKPIPDATVRLHPLTPPDDGKPVFTPRGKVKEDGTYAVTTYEVGDGAPAGEYLVSLSWQGPLKGISEEIEDRLRERLPRKYTSPRSSGIKVVIAEGENKIPEIEIR